MARLGSREGTVWGGGWEEGHRVLTTLVQLLENHSTV